MTTALTLDEVSAEVRSYKKSAFRMELQPAYTVDYERDLYDAFLAGNPTPPDNSESLQSWYRRVAQDVAAGKTIQRVRILDDPPTDYQRWTRWMVRWNLEAGEIIDWLPRARAYEVGLLPEAGPADWWLLDDSRLITIKYEDEYRPAGGVLATEETAVQKARMWRHLAVRTAREATT